MAGAAARGHVPVAQLDKASDYESEDWGFESLQGLIFFNFFLAIFFFSLGIYLFLKMGWCVGPGDARAAWMPERSKGADLRSAGRKSAWVRTPLQAYFIRFFLALFASRREGHLWL